MRTFGSFLAVGILALAAGCGGSTSTGIDGGGGAAGGGGGISGNGGAGGGGGGAAGSCNYPSCMASLAATCQPAGTCVEQVDSTTFASNVCYSNGVKMLTSINMTSGLINVAFKNGSSTCYTIEVSASATTGAETLTVKNASGAVIATGTRDTTGSTTTITCTGGAPVTLNAACQGSLGSPSGCTTGTCAP